MPTREDLGPHDTDRPSRAEPPPGAKWADRPAGNTGGFVYLVVASLFIGSMSILNVVGLTRFVSVGPLLLPIGVLPYPLTFLCTDVISEFYGKKAARNLVFVGLLVNIVLMVAILWAGHAMPPAPVENQLEWQTLELREPIIGPTGTSYSGSVEIYELIYDAARSAIFASMIAYLIAQLIDVQLFHFWKRLTGGRHLWLRNNGSTLVSQLFDTVIVLGITFSSEIAGGAMDFDELMALFAGSYAFKAAVALFDTVPFYAIARLFDRYALHTR